MAIDQEIDSATEDSWVVEQRSAVQFYLKNESVKYRQIGDWSAWHLYPILSVWAIESLISPGRVGWWVITGDVPTDYVSFGEIDHPRLVLSHFARSWAEVATCMLNGEPHPEIEIGKPDDWPELGDLLQRRATLLQEFADNDDIWAELSD